MVDSLRHRGPDDSGYWLGNGAALGHTRLAIIDLSNSGRQPMRSANDRFLISYNGEVYNYREIRHDLERQGVKFHGRSDTEVVLEAFFRWGTECFSRLNGMFAVALYDRWEHRLILARDRFGIKPLYIREQGDGLVLFASEIKSIMACPATSTLKVEPSVLKEFAWFGISLGEQTIWKGVRKLEPGSWIEYSREGVNSFRYWRQENIQPVHDDQSTIVRRTRYELEEAVRRHLIADVDVGVLLSGGIDSSAIAALASKFTSERLRTYSVGFDDPRGINELPKAKRVADCFNTDHSELHFGTNDALALVQRMAYHHDEPFADSANLPLFALAEQLKGRQKVVLQGDGGDEIFGGYRRYLLAYYEPFWRVLSAVVPDRLAGLLPNRQVNRLRRLLAAFHERSEGRRYGRLLTPDSNTDNPETVLGREIQHQLTQIDVFSTYERMLPRFTEADRVQKFLYMDSAIVLVNQFLEKVDRASMARGLETRVPLLDAELTQYVMGISGFRKVNWHGKKYLFRCALKGLVPSFVLNGKKTGFGVPFRYWLRGSMGDYARELTLSGEVTTSGLLDRDELEVRWKAHRAGKYDHGFVLWKAFQLGLWYQQHCVPNFQKVQIL